MIFQKYVSDTENTVCVLCYPDKKPLVAVPRIRLEAKGGISTKGKVIHDPQIQQNMRECCRFYWH